jgi:hypothetical protein
MGETLSFAPRKAIKS